MNDSFDTDECCSDLHHSKVSLEMNQDVCQLFNDQQNVSFTWLVLMAYCFAIQMDDRIAKCSAVNSFLKELLDEKVVFSKQMDLLLFFSDQQ